MKQREIRQEGGEMELTEKEIELILSMGRNQGQATMYLMSADEKRTAAGLCKKGYIGKGTAEWDGRCKVYSLTHKGLTAL